MCQLCELFGCLGRGWGEGEVGLSCWLASYVVENLLATFYLILSASLPFAGSSRTLYFFLIATVLLLLAIYVQFLLM